MVLYLARVLIAAVVIVGVSEVAGRMPRIGALILSLPITSMLAFIFTWAHDRNIATISTLSRETLILVPLTLVFFVPLAFAERLQINFWLAFLLGTIAAGLCVFLWFLFGPSMRS